MRYSKLTLLGLVLGLVCFTSRSMAQSVVSIVGSPHDLNHALKYTVTNGVGGVGNDGEVCLPCHTPHAAPYNSGSLLWNHQVDMSKPYTMYTVVNPASGSQSANMELDSTSRLCLSCHDGAVAVDSYGRNNDGSLMQSGSVKIGTLADHNGWTGAFAIAGVGNDLSADHPVGIGYPGLTVSGGVATFTPGTPNSFNNPLTATNFKTGGVAGGPGVKLVALPNGLMGVGCTSCHEPHDKSLWFQRMSNSGSALCLSCHIK
jgi:predicted CXXCH cytochrome family protein